jgi:hypothetical protein
MAMIIIRRDQAWPPQHLIMELLNALPVIEFQRFPVLTMEFFAVDQIQEVLSLPMSPASPQKTKVPE